MTPEERFMFDLEGYLIIKNVLTPEEIKRLNEVADATFVRDYDDPGQGFKGASWAPTGGARVCVVARDTGSDRSSAHFAVFN